MSNHDDIIEKLRALLRLAKSDNVHEAALAMQRAHDIAAKHQVDLSRLPAEDDLRAPLGRYMQLPDRLAQEWKEALNLIHNYFNVDVTCIRRGGRCLIVGTALDVELAEYVCTYLVRACRQCLAHWKDGERRHRRKTSGGKVASFIEGFFLGLRVKLHAQRKSQAEQHAGLALALALEDGARARNVFARSVLTGKITTITMPQLRRHRQSGSAGFIAGQSTEIRSGLRGGAPSPCLLPG